MQRPAAAVLAGTQPASPAAGGWTGSMERASAIKPAVSPGTAASTMTERAQVGGWAPGGTTGKTGVFLITSRPAQYQPSQSQYPHPHPHPAQPQASQSSSSKVSEAHPQICGVTSGMNSVTQGLQLHSHLGPGRMVLTVVRDVSLDQPHSVNLIKFGDGEG